jgi:hypothetical protein
MQQKVRLETVARALALEHATALRWVNRGLVQTDEAPRSGKGNATRLTRDQALELIALAMLRRFGAPMQQIVPIVKKMRREGKHGRDFFKLGADPHVALQDGHGPGVPMRDPRTGQLQLFASLDLRELEPKLVAWLDDMMALEHKIESARVKQQKEAQKISA